MLPHALTHADAAALDDRVYVIGGRGAVQGSQVDAILAVDPVSGMVRPAGRLPGPLSDTGVAAIDGVIMVAGGPQAAGVLSRRVYMLQPRVGAP